MRVFRWPGSLLALATVLVLLAVGPASAQGAGAQGVLCAKSLQFSLGATSLVQIVAPVTGQSIHICGLTLNAGAAAATYQLTVGTGTNCNANAVNITPAFSLGVNGVLALALGAYAWYSTPSPPAGTTYMLCHTITGTGPMQVLIQYHQS